MLFLFRSAPEVEKRIHSKLFRKFWRSRDTKEPAYITVQRLLPLFDVASLNCFVLTGHKLGAVTKTGCALKLSMDQFNNHFNSKKAAMEDFEILERKIASDIYKRIWSISSKTQFEVLFSSKHQ